MGEEGRVFQNLRDPGRDHSRGAQLLALAGFLSLALLVQASASAVISTDINHWFLSLVRPPATLPPQMFAGLWAGVELTLGLAAWLIWRQSDPWRLNPRPALRLWGWQVAVLAFWAPVFFRLRSPGLGLALAALLIAIAIATFCTFWRRDRWAGALLLPSFAWLCYGTYLNIGFWWLNRLSG